jgi:hypothetical protein
MCEEFQKFAARMQSMGIQKTYDQYYESGYAEISFEHTRQADALIRVDGYHRTDYFDLDIAEDTFLEAIAEENRHAAKYVGINTALCQLVIDQYKDAPFDLSIEHTGVETKVNVCVRQKDMELSLRNSALWDDGHVMRFRIRYMPSGELFLTAKQGRVRRSRSLVLKYDPVAEPQRFLDEVMPWFETHHEGSLRRVTVSFPHTFTGDHQTRVEWYEVYPGDEIEKAILGYKNCKVLMIDSLQIKQVVSRDLFGVVKGLYDHHLSKDITETVFAFRLPDDFEPNGREFAEVKIVAPVCEG